MPVLSRIIAGAALGLALASAAPVQAGQAVVRVESPSSVLPVDGWRHRGHGRGFERRHWGPPRGHYGPPRGYYYAPPPPPVYFAPPPPRFYFPPPPPRYYYAPPPPPGVGLYFRF